ncbi:hypothetical protein D3C80_570620 [compost metagenome]
MKIAQHHKTLTSIAFSESVGIYLLPRDFLRRLRLCNDGYPPFYALRKFSLSHIPTPMQAPKVPIPVYRSIC